MHWNRALILPLAFPCGKSAVGLQDQIQLSGKPCLCFKAVSFVLLT